MPFILTASATRVKVRLMKEQLPFFITVPHSGERVPPQTPWLSELPEEILMCDVDRFVDVLYGPATFEKDIPLIKTDWHRYAADLNRVPEDVDAGSVQNHRQPEGTHNRGFHWVITTLKYRLMPQPMSLKTHQELVQLIYEPFHQSVRNQYEKFHNIGFKEVYQIDAHSMPSVGTSEHRDPGERRADIVVSDCKGKSANPQFVDLIIAAYGRAGFKVAYNWPYFGGRVSEQYGVPARGQHAVQVEMNRALYMDEKTKKLLPAHQEIQQKINSALSYIQRNLSSFPLR
jgi:N-formylglutamate deformylase